MDDSVSGQLVGSEIHGFRTLQELDVDTMRGEAKTRWLRPNEIHAILCNHRYFGIRVKPVHLPESGNIILFDRKMLRNFRKDGHNWKKKNDGKTIKEAHEHLKVGNEERIHVYYAHGQDSPTFVRRCYWLLDKSLEHIVLVHYRETKEGSPSTSTNSNSCSDFDHSPPLVVTEELDPKVVNAYGSAASEPLAEGIESSSLRNHERRLYEINTLEWDELLGTLVINESIPHIGDKDFVPNQPCQLTLNGSHGIANPLAECMPLTEMTSLGSSSEQTALSISAQDNLPEGFSDQVLGGQLNSITESEGFSAVRVDESLATAVSGGLQNQDSFGRWIHSIVEDTPGSMHDPMLEPTIASVQDYAGSQTADHQQSHVPEHIFRITDVSPLWAYATEETKILVTGFFRQDSHHLAKSNMLCVCGDVSVPAELVQAGVYRCLVPQHSPGVVNFYLSIEGRKPISQVLNFEYRTPLSYEVAPAEDQCKWEEFETQMRLARLLFSTSKGLHVLSGKVSLNAVKEANKFARKTSSILNSWAYLMKLIENGRATFTQARDRLLEITLKTRLREWLLERIMEGCKTADYDTSGQGVIHLCAILGYTWAVDLFSWSGLSLDFRDKHGWTALHWAAYCGREKMVAVLLTAGAKPNLVTDPTPENPSGCTAFDLAYMKGFDGLAAYLSEMALVSQFKDMVLAGNARGSLKTNTVDAVNPENLSEDQLYMKDTLAAYRTAADAATRIQSAMRERAFKLRASALQFSNPEDEARHMVAAMKIQHAFRKYDAKKKMAAAAHIQYRYRAWKLRKEFLNMRRHAIRIQAAFRAFQTRRQYRKILWSVGIIDKAILRWRLKRRGFRGLQVNQVETMENERQQSDTVEEFFKIGQKQAEERVERAVVTVQSLFRSKKAQEEYTRMKLAHNQALLEYEGFLDPSVDADT